MRTTLTAFSALFLAPTLLGAQERGHSTTSSRPIGAPAYRSPRIEARPDLARARTLLASDLPGGAVGINDRPIDGASRGQGLNYAAVDRPVQVVFSDLRETMHRNIIVAPGVTAKFTGDIYSVSPEEAVELVCRSTGLVARDMGSYLLIEQDVPETRIYSLRNVPASEAKTLIMPALSGESSKVEATTEAVSGIESNSAITGGDAYANDGVLVVTDYAKNLEAVEEILLRLDQTPKQVMVEVMILSADLGAQDQLGVNFDALAGVDYRDYGASSDDGFSITNNRFSGDQLNDGLGRFGSNVGDGLARGGGQFGLITSSVAGFVRALEEKTAVSVATNTSISVLNKMKGEVLLGRRDGFKVLTTNNNGATSEDTDFLETGSKFIIRPFILEHEIVRMEIHPEDSDGGVSEEGIPSEETAELSTNVAVRSGETLVIGGLFREKKSSRRAQVPGLGDIPVAGHAFKSRDDSSTREELIFLITPHIIDLEAQAKAADLQRRKPHSRLGADRTALLEMYASMAQALALEGEFGCAMAILESADLPEEGVGRPFELQARITRGLVPEFEVVSVDARILDQLKRSVEGLR